MCSRTFTGRLQTCSKIYDRGYNGGGTVPSYITITFNEEVMLVDGTMPAAATLVQDTTTIGPLEWDAVGGPTMGLHMGTVTVADGLVEVFITGIDDADGNAFASPQTFALRTVTDNAVTDSHVVLGPQTQEIDIVVPDGEAITLDLHADIPASTGTPTRITPNGVDEAEIARQMLKDMDMLPEPEPDPGFTPSLYEGVDMVPRTERLSDDIARESELAEQIMRATQPRLFAE